MTISCVRLINADSSKIKIILENVEKRQNKAVNWEKKKVAHTKGSRNITFSISIFHYFNFQRHLNMSLQLFNSIKIQYLSNY